MDKSSLIVNLDNTIESESNISLIDYKNYYFPPVDNEDYNIQVVHCNYNKCSSSYRVNRKNYPYYVVEYIINGEGFFYIDEQEYKMKPGMVFGFCPETAHYYGASPASEGSLEKICISFRIDSKNDDFKLKDVLNRAFHLVNPVKVYNLFTEVLEQSEKNTLYTRRIINNLTEVLLLILKENDFSLRPYPNSFYTFNKCKSVLSEKSTIDISMSDVADECGVNISYMIRLFKRYMGCTPKQYIDKLVIECATSKLLESNASIKEISYTLGFTNQYYFSSFFKKHMNLSPSSLRKDG